MLKLSVKTRLDPLEVLERAKRYFERLTLVERIAHLHGQRGFTEVRVSGEKLIAKAEYDSETVLNDVINYIEDRFGLKPLTLSLHFHAPLGHINVTVSNEKPAEVTLESVENDYLVKEFASKLPKA